jgi:hypothetical protein
MKFIVKKTFMKQYKNLSDIQKAKVNESFFNHLIKEALRFCV